MTEDYIRLLKMKDGDMVMCATNIGSQQDLFDSFEIVIRHPVAIVPYQVPSGNGVAEGFLFKPWMAVCEETEFVILSENVVLVGTLKDDVEQQYKTYLQTRGNPPEDEEDEIEEWVATAAHYLKKNNLLN
jgi:hypothetical protein